MNLVYNFTATAHPFYQQDAEVTRNLDDHLVHPFGSTPYSMQASDRIFRACTLLVESVPSSSTPVYQFYLVLTEGQKSVLVLKGDTTSLDDIHPPVTFTEENGTSYAVRDESNDAIYVYFRDHLYTYGDPHTGSTTYYELYHMFRYSLIESAEDLTTGATAEYIYSSTTPTMLTSISMTGGTIKLNWSFDSAQNRDRLTSIDLPFNMEETFIYDSSYDPSELSGYKVTRDEEVLRHVEWAFNHNPGEPNYFPTDITEYDPNDPTRPLRS